MANGLRLIPQEIRTLEAIEIGSMIPLGGPLDFAVCLLKFTNTSDVDVFISWDGQVDNDICVSGGFVLYDVCTNAGSQRGLYVPAGTQFYVDGSAGTTGAIYLTCFHTSEY